MPRRKRCWCGRDGGKTGVCVDHSMEAMCLTLKLVALDDVIWGAVQRDAPPPLEDILLALGAETRAMKLRKAS